MRFDLLLIESRAWPRRRRGRVRRSRRDRASAVVWVLVGARVPAMGRRYARPARRDRANYCIRQGWAYRATRYPWKLQLPCPSARSASSRDTRCASTASSSTTTSARSARRRVRPGPRRVVADAIENRRADPRPRADRAATPSSSRPAFEKAATELNTQFVDRARTVAEGMDTVITRTSTTSPATRCSTRSARSSATSPPRCRRSCATSCSPRTRATRGQVPPHPARALPAAGKGAGRQMKGLNDKLEEELPARARAPARAQN